MSMELQTIKQAKEASGSKYSTAHIRKLCREGKIKGAQQIGKTWFLQIGAIESYKAGPQGFAAVKARKQT